MQCLTVFRAFCDDSLIAGFSLLHYCRSLRPDRTVTVAAAGTATDSGRPLECRAAAHHLGLVSSGWLETLGNGRQSCFNSNRQS